jgi:beta-glucosidase
MTRPSPRRLAATLALATAGAALWACSTTPKPPADGPAATRPAGTQAASQPAGRGRGSRGGGGAFGGAFGRGGRGRGFGAPADFFPFQDTSLSVDDRVDDLLARLSVDEKVAQTQMAAPAVERLGIPPYHWWNEALHGVARNGEATVFPQAIAMAATWDPATHFQMAKVIALEARAKHEEAVRQGIRAIYTGLDMWSPNINIFRDPRWGRGQETYGEDPYLTGRMGIAFVTGLQGADPFYFQTIATAKHFAVHSGPEIERHRFDAQPSEIDLRATYLPAFEALVREGKVYSVMASYNRVDGVPATASPRLLTDILRTEWGFQGYVTSDVDSVKDVYQNHQFAASPEEAAAASLKAGCDLNGGTTYQALAGAVKAGLVTEADLDKALRRLFTARIRLGLLDPDGGPYAGVPYSMNDSSASDQLALNAARQSIVLLKNDARTLPLDRAKLRTVAVIGPTADSLSALVGNYNGTPSRPVTLLQGIRDAVGPAGRVLYTPGCPIVDEQIPLAETVPAAALFTDASRKTPGLTADYFRDIAFAGNPIRTRVDRTVDFDWATQSARDPIPLNQGLSARWTGVLVPPESGEYQLGLAARDGFRMWADGKLIIDEWTTGNRRSTGASLRLDKDKPVAITVEYFHPRSAGGPGQGGGGGGGATGGGPALPASNVPPVEQAGIQLRWTRPTPDGHAGGDDGLPLYADALRAAQSSDAVVLVLGITADLEREEHLIRYKGFSDGDRSSIDLPGVQERLLEQVTAAAAGKPVVLVLTSGSALSVNWAKDHVPAVLEAWYPGQRGGQAVADVLFGRYNPAGRLPVTFYKSADDLPPFTDYAMAAKNGRTYRYFSGDVLWPFGFGLSYTTFEYSAPTAAATNPTTGDDVVLSVRVKNTGSVAGEEVVQLYADRKTAPAAASAAGVAPPPHTLLGFARVPLAPGEEKTVEFTVTPHQLALVTADGKRVAYPGPVDLRIGPNSADGKTLPIVIGGPPATPDYHFVAPRVR